MLSEDRGSPGERVSLLNVTPPTIASPVWAFPLKHLNSGCYHQHCRGGGGLKPTMSPQKETVNMWSLPPPVSADSFGLSHRLTGELILKFNKMAYNEPAPQFPKQTCIFMEQCATITRGSLRELEDSVLQHHCCSSSKPSISSVCGCHCSRGKVTGDSNEDRSH